MKGKKGYIIALLLAAMLAVTGCGAETGQNSDMVDGNVIPAESTAKEEKADEDALSGNDKAVSEDASASENKYSKVADSSDYTTSDTIDDSGLTPVTADELNDGDYLIDMESSSSMFKVADCLLTVSGDSMEITLRMESDSYLFMYAGTAKEAAEDKEENYISYANNNAGDQLYTMPLEALDKALSFASYSRKKEQWYDRTLLFESSSLPDEAFKEKRYKTAEDLKIEDGNYYIDVDLDGGSGRASIESPALLLIQDGFSYAMITWSSSNYDYMVVEDDMVIDAEIVDDKSTFVIPVKGFDHKLPVVADTTAMSKPHEIEYTLYFDSDTIRAADPEGVAPTYKGMKLKEKIRPDYATGFTIDEYENNIYRINVGNDKYLLVPKMTELPTNIPKDVTVIRTPVSNAYIASTSSMDFFTQIEGLENVAFAGAEASKWTDSKVSSLVERDTIHYVGKYDAPDYESLITGKADVAVENTMIYHSPETKEKLEELSIPVFVDLTSYETDPRGRVEWIKIYGLMTGRYGKAIRFFDSCCKKIDAMTQSDGAEASKKDSPKVAYFYISPKGSVGVRNPGDYISKMIEMAGGEYVPSDIKASKDKTSSSVDMSMEDFYLKVKDADILIYNGTLYGVPESVKDLTSDTALLSEFRAVKEGRVYASEDNMFQATCAAADVISDLTDIINNKASDMKYFSKTE